MTLFNGYVKHPKEPRSRFHQRRDLLPVAAAQKGIALERGGWQCGWCDQRLPPLPLQRRPKVPTSAQML